MRIQWETIRLDGCQHRGEPPIRHGTDAGHAQQGFQKLGW